MLVYGVWALGLGAPKTSTVMSETQLSYGAISKKTSVLMLMMVLT